MSKMSPSLLEPCSTYVDLSNESIVDCLIPNYDLKRVIEATNPQFFKFPVVPANLMSLLPKAPSDINININESHIVYYHQFLDQVNNWIEWYDKMTAVLIHVVHWLKSFQLANAITLYDDLYRLRDKSKITIIEMKTLIQKTLTLLQPFKNLRRLCSVLNCLIPFQVLKSASLNREHPSSKFIELVKRSHPDNFFKILDQQNSVREIIIQERQHVQWFIASERLEINVQIAFIPDDNSGKREVLFEDKNVAVQRDTMEGEFETLNSGSLVIEVNNERGRADRTVWFRIRQAPLSKSHLFEGIFNMIYLSSCGPNGHIGTERDLSRVLERVFDFIGSLLDGRMKLRDMVDLKAIFCNKNINIHDEVKKLFSHRSIANANNQQEQATTAEPTEQDIEQICEWLQIYQYYSYINIIITCVKQFNIISNENPDQTINSIMHLSDENCTLREITGTYRSLKERFKNLTSQHLQLIKTASECSNVIQMMTRADLYTTHGRRRFQELRDYLTTQFQLQERNNMILNSWIIIYELCEPFTVKVRTLEDFVDNVAKSSYFEDNPVTHMQSKVFISKQYVFLSRFSVVNDNIQLVEMWLSAEETNVLDNSLITMEHLYRTGVVHIQLRRLINEESKIEIIYSINKTLTPAEGDFENDEFVAHGGFEKNKIILTQSEIVDHKRQLTFCNVDLSETMKTKKILLNEQLKLLNTVNNMYSTMIQLETAGHPDYQLREETFQLTDRAGEISRILTRTKDNENEEVDILKRLVERQTDQLHLVHQQMLINYNLWLQYLDEYRKLSRLLQLFSNRQVMILIILLTKPTPDNRIKWDLLKKLHLKNDNDFSSEQELQLTLQSLRHYARSLRLSDCDLSIVNIKRLYNKHEIPVRSTTDTCLQKLSTFLKELLNDGKQFFTTGTTINDNQQYLVTLPHKDQVGELNPLEHDLDMETFSILVNIFNHHLPSSFQILWCSNATEDDIRLFFRRIQTFCHLTFVIMDIDKMHHRLKEILFNEQDILTRTEQAHGEIYYFSRELTSRKGLLPYLATPQIRNSDVASRKLNELFQSNNWIKPRLHVICGKAGIGKLAKFISLCSNHFQCPLGKTHRINTEYKTPQTLSMSINDRLNLSSLINALLSFDSNENLVERKVYFNISIHAPFDELNRTFFSLLVCGALMDLDSGLVFSLPDDHKWTFLTEIPHIDKYTQNINDHFKQILPLLSLFNSNHFEEVTETNYQLYIGNQEEVVARFLKAYENRTINQLYVETFQNIGTGLEFARLTDHEECRRQINQCMRKNAPELLRNKISELSFVKFLFRRVRFFTDSGFYRYNDSDQHLGTRAMEQMIEEAKNLSQMNFHGTDYPRIFLVYDPGFALYLLHTEWNRVPQNLKEIFKREDPAKRSEFAKKDYFAACLSWLLDILYDDFIDVMNETKFILTENFTYKLFHVHERKLTKLPLIIEGHTGVGKTFLLKFYSMLLNAKLTKGSLDGKIAPRVRERLCVWMRETIFKDLPPSPIKENLELFNTVMKQIKQGFPEAKYQMHDKKIIVVFQDQEEIEDTDDNQMPFLNEEAAENEPIDDAFLQNFRSTLSKHKLENNALRFIWKTIVTTTHRIDLNICRRLNKLLYEHITSQMANFPLMETSPQLAQLLILNSLEISPLDSIKLFDEYLMYTNTKSLFYRLLLHPGVTEEQLEDFMKPICQLATAIPNVELVVFFDEVNTSTCLGLFKEMFMDGTLHGKNLPTNIFFTAAINPWLPKQQDDEKKIHRTAYLVRQLPQALENLKASYSTLESNTLKDYIAKKIATFSLPGIELTSLNTYIQEMLTECIVKAQEFCEKFLCK